MAKLTAGTTIDSNISWHAGNDGSGSGLDADKLDGVHLSAIAQKTDYATDKVGGTVKMRIDGSTLYIRNDGNNA